MANGAMANSPGVEKYLSGVRCAAISTLGRIIECKVREARDKTRLTLKIIVKDLLELSPILATSLVSTFAVIASTCPQNYIEDIIATDLSTIASFALQQSRNIELVNALKAYSMLVYCPLSSQCASGIVLPELRHLNVGKSMPTSARRRGFLRMKPIERTLDELRAFPIDGNGECLPRCQEYAPEDE